MRIPRVTGLVLLSLAVLVIGGVAAHAGWQTLQARQLHAEVEGEVSARLAEAVPAALHQRDRVVRTARAVPDREELVQHCEFATRDAGLVVQSHQQSCDLRGTLTWSATDRAQADALAHRIAVGSGETFKTGFSDAPGCTVLQSVDLVVVVTDRECGYPPTSGLRPVRPVRGHRVGGLRVEVRSTAPLGEYELGCRTVVLFCDNPFHEPAFGTPPAATPAPR